MWGLKYTDQICSSILDILNLKQKFFHLKNYVSCKIVSILIIYINETLQVLKTVEEDFHVF